MNAIPLTKIALLALLSQWKFIPKKLVTSMTGRKIVEMIVSLRTTSESWLFWTERNASRVPVASSRYVSIESAIRIR